jgi:hypothetical protein
LRGDEGVHVDQRLDVGIAGGGVGDDGATVGVADQDDRPGDGLEVIGQVSGVVAEAAQPWLGSHD